MNVNEIETLDSSGNERRRFACSRIHPAFLWLATATLVACASGIAETKFEPLPIEGQTFLHDPSNVVSENGRYHVFATGPGIRIKTSLDLTNWSDAGSVFKEPPSWTTNAVPEFRGRFWAPDIIRVGDQYLLYYSVSSFGKQVSAIGLATSPTLDATATNYAWTDRGPVIESAVGSPFNAIDPSLMLDVDGRLWMAFGSFWRGIYLTQLDAKTGLRLETNSPVYRVAWKESIEAVCLTRRADHYYLFVNWGTCCKGTNSTYEVRVGRSREITGPYLDRDGKNLVDGGGTLFLETTGRYIGPGHIGVANGVATNGFSYHYYDADSGGRSRLALGRLEWTDDGWPVATK
ncbi:MAG TPA: arabinan endo-1,5-alpha-L-arabinosidase [Verrucomicrobiota bacterium]|nr:arabinan endo-1,5-alpha-L-arabinosidase [Verrucomicrobiota bacterium]